MSAAPPPTAMDGESKVANAIAMVAATLAIAAVTTAARFYCRAVVIKKLGFDDWSSFAALLCTIGCGVAIAVNTQNGLGRHIWTINMANFPQYLKVFYVSIVMYGASITAIKATFLLQYQRVFSIGSWKNRFTYALVIVTGWSVASLLVSIWSCVPIEGFWDQTVEARCIPNHPWWEINAAGNIVSDFVVFCLPIPTLWKLKMPKSQKIALLAIFCLGFFTCAISLVRIKYLQIAADMTWDNVESGTWSMLELVSGIVCANLATLRPLFRNLLPSLAGSHGSKQSGVNGAGSGGQHGGSMGLADRSIRSDGRIPLGSASGSTPKTSEAWAEHSGARYEARVASGEGLAVHGADLERGQWKLSEKSSAESVPSRN